MAIFYSYFELMASLFILLMSFYIFSRYHDDKAARFYARLSLVGFFAAIFEYSMRIAFTLEIARGINRISIIFLSFMLAMFVQFAMIFTRRYSWLSNRITYIILYLPAIIVSSLFLFTNLMYSYYEIRDIGIVSQPSPLYWIFTIYSLAYVLLACYLFVSCARRVCHHPIIQKQSEIIAMGAMLSLLLASITDQIIPLIYGTRIFPPTVVFSVALMGLFVFIAMRKYNLFTVSPGFAAETIIETMPDSLMITDLEGRVLSLNKEAQKFFHVPKEQIIGKPICKLFKDVNKYNQLFCEVADKNLEIQRFETDLIDPQGEKIPSIINANKVRDSFGITIGVVYVIRDIRG